MKKNKLIRRKKLLQFGEGIFFLALLFLCSKNAFAKTNWQQNGFENTLSLSGDCSEDVKVALYKDKSFHQLEYTAGAACQDGHFSFSDNLLDWNISDGEYFLVVNDEKDTIGEVAIRPTSQNAVSQSVPNNELSVSSAPVESPSNGDVFSETESGQLFEDAQMASRNNIENLRESLRNMRTGLSDTSYSQTTKVSMGSLLDLLDTAFNVFDQLFFQVELRDFPTEEMSSQENVNEVDQVDLVEPQKDVSVEDNAGA